MRRTIVGTAGHIDHGKTRLLEALTGIDCDRWAEEKARGITIDLGFAHLREGDLQVGFIDVPGHERFLHNALAGLGGIRLVLLVVAADEGVKPQTREHLAICSLLEIPHAIVALTKRDLVDDDLLELAQLEVEELLETTPFAGAPVLPVSSTSGEGIDVLRAALLERAAAIDGDGDGGDAGVAAPLRLPVDRAFHLKGLGVVVTGTLLGGRVAVGDGVEVLSSGRRGAAWRTAPRPSARVRSIQVHGEARDEAVAGERTALQLAGVELDDVARGSQLAAAGVLAPSKTLCARLTLLDDAPEALEGYAPVRFHLYSGEVVGKLRPLAGAIEPGGTGLVEIRLAEPVAAVRGDHYIARRPSPAATLGGGRILDPHWRRRRGKGLVSALAAIEDDERALVLWVEEAGERGRAAEELSPRLGIGAAEVAERLDAASRDGRLLRIDTGRGVRYLAPAVPERVIARGRALLADFLAADRLARGMPKAQLVAGLLPARARDLADVYLRLLAAEGVLQVDGDVVNPPGRSVELTGEESALAKGLLAAVEAGGLTPPAPSSLAGELGAKPQILDGVVRHLIDRGKLVQLPSGLVLSSAAIDDLRASLRAAGWADFGVADFKDRFGISRKWAIPLLEHLDSTGVTRRVGDKRQLVGGGRD